MRSLQGGKLKAITFSYDDGVSQDIKLIELLNKYGLKCTFNINSGKLGRHDILIREGQRIASYKIEAQHLKDIYEGHEIAAHTLTHPNLINLEEKDVIRQVEDDRQALSELVGYEVVGMAYPCGGVNDAVIRTVREKTGIKYGRTTICTGSFEPQDNLYHFNPSVYHLDFDKMMALGEAFVAMKPTTPQILYIWGHAYELDYRPDYWAKLDEFFRLIANRDDIFYGTNSEVLL